ncbi:MAG: hypothetical protein ACK5HP_01840 [Bacilli bacterium]
MKKLYIDFDGVILDTISPSYKKLQELGISTKDYNKCHEFYKSLNWNAFIKKSEQINNSIKNIQKLIDSKLFEISILTHVLSINEATAKIKYIKSKINNLTVILVPKELNKTDIVDSKDAILIDDFDGNLIEWEKQGGIGICFSTKLAGKGFKVIDSLDQILDIVT